MKPNEVPEISLREIVTRAFGTLNTMLGEHVCKLNPKDRRIIQNALACYGTCIEIGVIDDEYTDEEIVNVLKKSIIKLEEIKMANFNYNKVTLAGRLVADPELRETQNGVSVANARIAVTRRSFNGEEPATDFFNIVAWRGGADFLAKYFKKGSSVCVNGTLQTGTYTDANGENRYFVEVVADEIYFVDSKSESAERAQDTKPAANTRNNTRNNPTRNRR